MQNDFLEISSKFIATTNTYICGLEARIEQLEIENKKLKEVLNDFISKRNS